MALTLRNSFLTVSGTVEVEVELPAGTASSDLLLLLVVSDEDVVATPPGGFQLVPGAQVTGTTRTQVFQKIAGSDEPSRYWVRWASGDGSAGLIAIDSTTLQFAVVHEVAVASSEVASTNKVWAEVTNTDSNTLLLCFGGFGSNASSTPDGAMTERFDGRDPRVYLMTQGVAASGATGTRTATGSSVATQRCITISITESSSYPITYPAELNVSEFPTFLELSGSGAQVTQFGAVVEFGARGVYLSQFAVLVELDIERIWYYSVGDEHDIPVAFLNKLSPQPHCKGVRITRRDGSQSGNAHQDDALYILLEWNVVKNVTAYRSILDQFGLLDARENDVTVTARDETRNWARWNGTAVRPRVNEDVRRDGFFARGVRILVKDVELAQ